jgi:Tfp pilus tip-associated adhesin PilY1
LFGYKAKSYKRYDNVSEMYAVALRYLLGPSGIGHVPSYSVIPSGVTATQRVEIKDDFPVITNWLDPVLPASHGGAARSSSSSASEIPTPAVTSATTTFRVAATRWTPWSQGSALAA